MIVGLMSGWDIAADTLGGKGIATGICVGGNCCDLDVALTSRTSGK